MRLRTDFERLEARWTQGDCIAPKPEQRTSSYIFTELRLYVKMENNAAAWDAHQSDATNRLNNNARPHAAMPVVTGDATTERTP